MKNTGLFPIMSVFCLNTILHLLCVRLSGSMLVVISRNLKLSKEGYVHTYSYTFQRTRIHFRLWRDILYHVVLPWFLSCSAGEHFPILHSSISIRSRKADTVSTNSCFHDSYFNDPLRKLVRTAFHVDRALSPWCTRCFPLKVITVVIFSFFYWLSRYYPSTTSQAISDGTCTLAPVLQSNCPNFTSPSMHHPFCL